MSPRSDLWRSPGRNFKKEGAAGHGDTEGQVSSSVDGAKPFLEYQSKRWARATKVETGGFTGGTSYSWRRRSTQLGWPWTNFGKAGSGEVCGDEVCEIDSYTNTEELGASEGSLQGDLWAGCWALQGEGGREGHEIAEEPGDREADKRTDACGWEEWRSFKRTSRSTTRRGVGQAAGAGSFGAEPGFASRATEADRKDRWGSRRKLECMVEGKWGRAEVWGSEDTKRRNFGGWGEIYASWN